MDALGAWIKQIILLVLFATFLELLIPNNNYKKFIKVIMGLLILLAVLQPILDFIQTPWDEKNTTEVAARNLMDNKTEIINQSTGIQSERDRIAMEQYHKELVKQIRVLAGAVEGVAEIKAEVALKEGKSEKDYGMIKNITVFAKTGYTDKDGAMVKTVKRVEVDQSTQSSQEYAALDERKQEQIKRVLAEFYHLKTEQIMVKEWQGK